MIPLTKLYSHFNDFEGDVPHFYLDGAGIVTIGKGCQVWDTSYAMSLVMNKKNNNSLALPNEIAEEYNIVKKLESGRAVKYYDSETTLFMSAINRTRLFDIRLQGIIRSINDTICKLDEFPEAAQIVLIDMVYNLGKTKFVNDFVNFLPAFLGRNWTVCLDECERKGISKSRNAWTRDQFEFLKGI